MTVQQDVKRAALRAMIAESMNGVPEYSADPKVVCSVGNMISGTANYDERHVRASDSLLRSTSRVTIRKQARSGPNMWLWSASKGAKPVDLPVEQATKFELVVNNRTAKVIGLSIRESFLLRAHAVIE